METEVEVESIKWDQMVIWMANYKVNARNYMECIIGPNLKEFIESIHSYEKAHYARANEGILSFFFDNDTLVGVQGYYLLGRDGIQKDTQWIAKGYDMRVLEKVDSLHNQCISEEELQVLMGCDNS
jgi:hypothetical protein